MCRLIWDDEWDAEPAERGQRPSPRLAWVVPVSIVDLAPALHAWGTQQQRIETLLLCHRFGKSPLSRLPQEILDQITHMVRWLAAEAAQGSWKKMFECFQGACTTSSHSAADESALLDTWDDLYGCTGCQGDCDMEQDRTDTEKIEMVHDAIEGGGGLVSFHERRWDEHMDNDSAWLEKTCLCRSQVSKTGYHTLYDQNKLLQTDFGLEIIVFHEALSSNLDRIVPHEAGPHDRPFYTSCFLTLAKSPEAEDVACPRVATGKNDAFSSSDSLAFLKRVRLEHLNLDGGQERRFARALRLLDLKPHFHLTELEAKVQSKVLDPALLNVSSGPKHSGIRAERKARDRRFQALENYVKVQSEELAKQPWPQLMLMCASSGLVTPT